MNQYVGPVDVFASMQLNSMSERIEKMIYWQSWAALHTATTAICSQQFGFQAISILTLQSSTQLERENCERQNVERGIRDDARHNC